MWNVKIEKEKIGPMQYRIWTTDAGIPDETRIEIRDEDLLDKPLLHQVTGLAVLEYIFPAPGQYLVKFRMARIRADAPDAPPEVGFGSVIIRVAAEEIPDQVPAEDPPEEPAPEVPPAELPREGLIQTGLRLLDWILTMERTEAQAFAIGLLVGAAAGAVGVLTYLG